MEEVTLLAVHAGHCWLVPSHFQATLALSMGEGTHHDIVDQEAYVGGREGLVGSAGVHDVKPQWHRACLLENQIYGERLEVRYCRSNRAKPLCG